MSHSRALHNLRGFVIVVVIAFHSVLAYLGSLPPTAMPFDDPPYLWRSFPINDSERWFGFDLFCALQDIYLISLMFFLSGLFVWPSLARKGTGQFLRDRLVRIALPFVLAVAILMPIAHYPVYRSTAADPSLAAYWEHWLALPFWPSGPPWFLWILFVLDALAAALFAFARRWGDALGAMVGRLSTRPAHLAAVLLSASAIAYIPLALAFTPWEWVNFGVFAFQICRPLHYAVYFFAGMGVGAYGIERGPLAVKGFLMQHWTATVLAALGTYLLWLGTAGLAMYAPSVFALQFLQAAVFVVACGAGVTAAVALSLRFASRQIGLIEPMSQNAYGIYLIHYVFVVWLQFALLGLAVFAILKGMIVFAGTLALSLAAVAGLGRVPAAGRIIGMHSRAVPKTR
jgi:surface polysaccharide O-acyltransferase-like enzyme